MAKARYRKRPSDHRRRMFSAICLSGGAVTILFVVFGGYIFKATQGSEVGMYATVLLIIAGLSMALGSCYVTLRMLVDNHRTTVDNIVPFKPREEAAHKKSA